MLHTFCTTLAFSEPVLAKIPMPANIRDEFAARVFPEVPSASVVTHPLRESVRQIARRAGWKRLTRHETGLASYHQVYYALDLAVARRLPRLAREGAGSLYAYEDGAMMSFTAAEQLGLTCVYDLPSPHWRAVKDILEEERDRQPDWAGTMDGLIDSDQHRKRKDRELHLSDRILVASSFSRSALGRYLGMEDVVTVVPYGAPSPRTDRVIRRGPGQPIRIFFAGRLSQSKGFADLVAALGRLDIDWQATIAGGLPREVPDALSAFLKRDNVEYLGFVTPDRLFGAMTQAHVFVFPSLYEGFGMVLTEAMACGLPIIATPHTAAPDLITDGREGFIVPIRDPDAIADRITRLAENEDLRQAMAQAALDLAARSPWSRYEEAVAAAVGKAVAQ
ncbi:glycosyltransferase family 4 protein [Rhodovulum marinum]|nr:glycosyltransferase family 4 protein [Rhodovulum marinum]